MKLIYALFFTFFCTHTHASTISKEGYYTIKSLDQYCVPQCKELQIKNLEKNYKLNIKDIISSEVTISGLSNGHYTVSVTNANNKHVPIDSFSVEHYSLSEVFPSLTLGFFMLCTLIINIKNGYNKQQ